MKLATRTLFVAMMIFLAELLVGSSAPYSNQPEQSPIHVTVEAPSPVTAPPAVAETSTVSVTAGEEWRATAKSVDGLGFVTYSDTADGAVMAFEGVFKAMVYDFTNRYTYQEESASTQKEKSKLIHEQLPLMMQYVDSPSLGADKVDALIKKWVVSSRMIGTGGAEIKAANDGVAMSPDGTVTITDSSILYRNPSSKKFKPLGSDGEQYKLTYKDGIWKITDMQIKQPVR